MPDIKGVLGCASRLTGGFLHPLRHDPRAAVLGLEQRFGSRITGQLLRAAWAGISITAAAFGLETENARGTNKRRSRQ